MTKQRPITFNATNVRAVLYGTRTQDRWIVKPQPDCIKAGKPYTTAGLPSTPIACPFGQVGDQLWVRETFSPIYPQDPNYNNGLPIEYDYAASYTWGDRLGDTVIGKKKKWKPYILMPRAASRITLEITSVRVERLQDISGADAIAEGIERLVYQGQTSWRDYSLDDEWAAISPMLDSPIASYKTLWESINGVGSWDLNPWVWVIEFKKVKP